MFIILTAIKQRLENLQSEIDCGVHCACRQAPEHCMCGGYDREVAPWTRPRGTRFYFTRKAVAQLVRIGLGRVRHFFWWHFANGKQITALRRELSEKKMEALRAKLALRKLERATR